ncbi:MAG TPA: hypothetical protein VJ841_02480, partial [Candidatus Saccharimonadales bacterium]|nr:hypothetical protein [Candidatus Saccharimonadales bacterium]
GNIDVEMAWHIGKAVSEWLASPGHVVVFYAPLRQQLATAIIEGVRLQGRDAADGGAGDISLAAEHAKKPGCAGAIVVGQVGDTVTIEVCQAGGTVLTGGVLTQLHEQARAGNFVPARTKGDLIG